MNDSMSPYPNQPTSPDGRMVATPYGTQASIVPQVFGWLNICFSLILLSCGVCIGGYAMILAQMVPMMKAQQAQMNATMETRRAEQIEGIEARLAEAATDEERIELRAQIKQVQDRPQIKPPDFEKLLFKDHRAAIVYGVTDLATGALLNLCMLLAGVGLVFRQNWARVGSLLIAALKIIRHTVLLVAWMLVVVPAVSKVFTDMFEQMMADAAQNGMAAGPQPPAGTIGAIYTAYAVFLGISIAFGGLIYPLLSLWFLSRESTRRACLKPESAEPIQPSSDRFTV